eukprot:4165358-Pyramimonas_sp.AAC.1
MHRTIIARAIYHMSSPRDQHMMRDMVKLNAKTGMNHDDATASGGSFSLRMRNVAKRATPKAINRFFQNLT